MSSSRRKNYKITLKYSIAIVYDYSTEGSENLPNKSSRSFSTVTSIYSLFTPRFVGISRLCYFARMVGLYIEPMALRAQSFHKACTCEDRSAHSTLPSSCNVTDLTPLSTTFFAISTPSPRSPEIRTLDAPIRRIASWPNTYLSIKTIHGCQPKQYTAVNQNNTRLSTKFIRQGTTTNV